MQGQVEGCKCRDRLIDVFNCRYRLRDILITEAGRGKFLSVGTREGRF